jgi:hypothetical protein
MAAAVVSVMPHQPLGERLDFEECSISSSEVLDALKPDEKIVPHPINLQLHCDKAAMPDVETSSLTSELECPVCFQQFCEPIRAGCERHIFCRNCLLKSQGLSVVPRCPICRFESQRKVTEAPEVASLVAKLRRLSSNYCEREREAQQEREEYLKRLCLLKIASISQELGQHRSFEVSGAGLQEVNGLYVPAQLPTYVGPTVYRKANSFMFLYRWSQTYWVIAELRTPNSMGCERHWLYHSLVENPMDIPPMRGWQVPARSRHGRNPAPNLRLIAQGEGLQRARVLSQQPLPALSIRPLSAQEFRGNARVPTTQTLSRHRAEVASDSVTDQRTIVPEETDDPSSFSPPRLAINVQAKCKCTPQCTVM